jgi:hypothetical protein
MVKICVASGHQCGSTRLFNLVQLLFDRAGFDVHAGMHYDTDAASEARVDEPAFALVTKQHNAMNTRGHQITHTLVAYRDLRDAYMSACRRKFVPNAPAEPAGDTPKAAATRMLAWMHMNVDVFRRAAALPNPLLVRYEDYGRENVAAVAAHVGLAPTEGDISAVMAALDRMHTAPTAAPVITGRNAANCRTVCTRGHNTAGGRTGKYVHGLDRALQTACLADRRLRALMVEHGYSVVLPPAVPDVPAVHYLSATASLCGAEQH